MEAADKQHAVELIGQLDGSQLAAVVHLLEIMVDPVAYFACLRAVRG